MSTPKLDSLTPLVEAAAALAALNASKNAALVSAQPAATAPLPPTHHVVSDDSTAESKEAAAAPRKKRETFPQKLMAVLRDPSLTDVVTWLPHGRSFVILRPDVFTASVLAKYFPSADSKGSTKYPSFTRKLNRWGFRQATRGPDTGAFHHELFRRDQPDLCLGMVCQRTKSRETNTVSKRSTERKPPPKRASSGASHTAGESVAHTGISISDDSLSKASNESSWENIERPFSDISTDAKLVNSALKKRDSLERLNASKAMLFESYIKALKEKGSM